jgi:hypothetical protein
MTRKTGGRISRDSTTLAAATYDGRHGRLELDFRDARRYTYSGVTPNLYRDLLGANSKGSFFQLSGTDAPVRAGPLVRLLRCNRRPAGHRPQVPPYESRCEEQPAQRITYRRNKCLSLLHCAHWLHNSLQFHDIRRTCGTDR